MKLINVLRHPGLLIASFLLILISGESFGGFYLLYILMGLPHGAPHALIAIGALGAVLAGHNIKENKLFIRTVLYILGVALMTFALYIFFVRSSGYNNSTFSQTVPLISIGVFSTCSLCFLIVNFFIATQNLRKNKQGLKIA